MSSLSARSMSLRAIPTWQLAVTSFAPLDRRAGTHRLLASLPVSGVLLLQTILTLRLRNVAFSDEALYLNAGHAYLTQWSGGAAVQQNYGTFFSGLPTAYPVFAAVIDNLGGLELVRLASLLMMLGATLSVGIIGAHLSPPSARRTVRITSMLFFVLTGPVIVVGNFATYDAACMSAVIAAAALAITRPGYGSALLAGAIVAVAGVCKYSGAVFVPVIVALALFASPSLMRGALRAAMVAVVAVGGLVAVYLANASSIASGIQLTTANRTALNPRSAEALMFEFARGVGLLAVLAVIGTMMLLPSRIPRQSKHARSFLQSVRTVLVAVTMLAAGVAIPASQIHIHEYTSFDKHLTFAAIFLAPLAGQVAMHRGRLLKPLALVVVVYLLAVGALYRSQFMFHEWPDTSPVTAAIQHFDRPGTYMGPEAQTMAYYSRDHAQLAWQEPYVLFGAGRAAIKKAVAQKRYAGISYVTGATGNSTLDSQTAYLAQVLKRSQDYQLVGSWAKHKYDINRFYLYLRKPGPAVETTTR